MSEKDRPIINRFKEVVAKKDIYSLVSESYRNKKGEEDWHGKRTHGSVRGSEISYYLPKGLRILRYGAENGYFAAPIGTLYEQLAMPYKIRSMEYHEYEVVADGVIRVILVKKGIVAKQRSWPDEPGGGVQFYFPDRKHHKTVLHYVDRGLRRLEESEWSQVQEKDIQHR